MSEPALFHTYIVSGTRDEAREHIERMLAPFSIARLGNPDFFVTEQVTFSIDDARALRSWQELTSAGGGKKIYIAYADFMTREAENALLKTLEEPVPNTHIIFAIPKPDVLLPTLLSRVRIERAVKITKDIDDGPDAQKFLALTPAQRLAAIAKIVEKSEDEEAAAEVRERTLAHLNSLEKYLAEEPQKNQKKLELILKLKKYVYISGASSRMILETIALSF